MPRQVVHDLDAKLVTMTIDIGSHSVDVVFQEVERVGATTLSQKVKTEDITARLNAAQRQKIADAVQVAVAIIAMEYA